MLQRNDMNRALRAAVLVEDRELAHVPAPVSAELARAITDSSEEPGETAALSTARQPTAVRRVRHRAVPALALVAAASLAVTLLQTFGGATSQAFADWQPVPQILTGAAAQRQIDKCPYFNRPSGMQVPSGAQTLVEQRGRMVFIVFAGAREVGTCMMLDGNGDGAGEQQVPDLTGSENVVSNGGSSSFTFDASGTRVDTNDIVGRAGSQVTSILIHRTDGVTVTAAVHDGLWAAWWPGKAPAATLTVQTRDGRSYNLPSTATGDVSD